MKVTATVTVEVNGQKLVLTHAEAQELLGALTAALAAPSLSPMPWPWAPYSQPYYVGDGTTTDAPWTAPTIVTCQQ